jgi:rhodanese-related sulfurtransferase
MQKAKLWAMVLTFGLALVVPGACASSEKAPRQDKETLKSWLSDPEVVIIDVRSSGDWEKATTKIKGAVRHDPKEVKAWATTVPKDKKIILYCA